MTSSSDRIDRIESLLERFIDTSVADRQASNERMSATDERLAQLSEKTDTRFNQLVEEADANRAITFEMLRQMTVLQEQMAVVQQENKQILEYLFGQQRSNGRGETPQP